MTTTFRIFGPGERGRGGVARDGSYARARDEITEVREHAARLEDHLSQLREEPLLVATIVEIRPDHDDPTSGRMLASLGPGNAIDIAIIEGVAVGARVRLNRNTMQALDMIDGGTSTELGSAGDVPAGTIVTVTRYDERLGIVEAETMGALRAFRSGLGGLRKGERVVIDPSMTFVIGTLGMPPQTYAHAAKIKVEWNDIGGQADAKAALREAIELPFSHPELFKAYGKRTVAGVLLSGPAGTGKTLIGKASATAIARAHGKDSADAGGFVYVKGPELLNAYIGRTEESIRRIFAAARDHKAAHGYPAVIFLDECDALLGARDQGRNLSMNATTVPQFLAEMDGLDDKAAILILATNRPDMLDSAVLREGRVDRRVRVGRPSQADAEQIFRIHLRGRPINYGHDDPQYTFDHMVSAFAFELFNDARVIREGGGGLPTIHLRDFASGAMIAGVVEQASTRAMERDIAAGATAAGGISFDDLSWAIDRIAAQLAHTNHTDVIREILKRVPQPKETECPT